MEPGQSLLDLGIGSGLSSIPFHRAGLRVHGLDGSPEILKICEAKHFAADLVQHDLRDLPLPYSSLSFDLVVSVGVLNSFRDLGPLFQEISRIVKHGGAFAFTVEAQRPGEEDSYSINRENVSDAPQEEMAVRLYRHGDKHIAQLLEAYDFVARKQLEFVAFKYPAENRDVFFTAYVARRIK